jgi:hypothetical protein
MVGERLVHWAHSQWANRRAANRVPTSDKPKSGKVAQSLLLRTDQVID